MPGGWYLFLSHTIRGWIVAQEGNSLAIWRELCQAVTKGTVCLKDMLFLAAKCFFSSSSFRPPIKGPRLTLCFRPDREKERCSGSFHLAVRFLVINVISRLAVSISFSGFIRRREYSQSIVWCRLHQLLQETSPWRNKNPKVINVRP